jgi:rhodanese-related sulfurtransferase
VYCAGGYRSALAAESLQKLGYKNVKSLEGGIGAWKEAGLPTVVNYSSYSDKARFAL